MLVTTTENIPGQEYRVLGSAWGLTTMAPNAVRNFGAGLKNIFGGEIRGYTKVVEKSRQRAIARLEQNARDMGADAVVMMRFDSDSITTDMETVVAYGTAVKFTDIEGVS